MKLYKTWAEISLPSLCHNWHAITSRIADPACTPIAVVKANAYGHGAATVARTLYAEGCRFFAVSCVSEAEEIRALLPDAEILILGYSMPQDAPELCRMNIIQTVFDSDFAAACESAMADAVCRGILPYGARLRVHIKLDTGMNRIGFDAGAPPIAAAEIAEIARMPHLQTEGMFTHFACADGDHGTGMSADQLARYIAVRDSLREMDACPAMLHCCNSAGILHMPHAYMNGVRAGIILYGMSPDGSILPEFQPVMRLKTRIAHIHTLRAGESVSYGATFTAERDMRIATLPIGYADGWTRRFSGAEVRLPDGSEAPIVGRICMDQCMISIGDADVRPGDPVTLFGDDDGTMIEVLARRAQTINYEITSLITARVPRVEV